MEVMSWSSPAMDVWVEVKESSYREGGTHAEETSDPRRWPCRRRDDAFEGFPIFSSKIVLPIFEFFSSVLCSCR